MISVSFNLSASQQKYARIPKQPSSDFESRINFIHIILCRAHSTPVRKLRWKERINRIKVLNRIDDHVDDDRGGKDDISHRSKIRRPVEIPKVPE